jgi:hypothetical protein
MEIRYKSSSLAALLLVAIHEIAYFTTYETITIEVAQRNTIFKSDHADPSEGYLPINWQIHTAEETFRVSPDWRRGEFAAAERYHSLKAGQTYRVRVAGWSLPFINWHRNIVNVER